MSTGNARGVLDALYAAALAACDPEAAVAAAMSSRRVRSAVTRARRLGLFALGKAAAGMARGAAVREDESLVILPRGEPGNAGAGRRVLYAAHPEPDRTSVAAAREAVRFFRRFGLQDVILCLLSGGASSLLCLPRPGFTLSEKRRRVARLAASGASIGALNRLRTSLSAVKGGRLGRQTRARLVTLVLSDVAGDAPSLVGSGPTIRGRRSDVVAVVGRNRTGLLAARREAERLGLRVRLLRGELAGEARDAGTMLGAAAARMPRGSVLVAGGEPTVVLGKSAGRGGRSLEVALAAAVVLEGTTGIVLLAASSDGRDGSSDAAGALVDGQTIARARRRGLDPEAAFERHATEDFFRRAGGLVVTGPTGTNVRDWVFACRP
ncbi:MAG: DUF4147 domain-containing protein [Thermoanaerobaculia bacterium]